MKAPYQLLVPLGSRSTYPMRTWLESPGSVGRTLVRIEKPQSVSEESIARVQAALEARGVKFLPSGAEVGPGLRISAWAVAPPALRRHEPGRKRSH